MTATRHPILFTGANRAMAALGMSSKNSYLEIGDDEVTVRMGWGFAFTAPRASIGVATLDPRRVWGWGAHGWRGRWLVNGSSSNIVCFPVDPAGRARLLGFVPVRVSELRVSVTDPAAVIDELSA